MSHFLRSVGLRVAPPRMPALALAAMAVLVSSLPRPVLAQSLVPPPTVPPSTPSRGTPAAAVPYTPYPPYATSTPPYATSSATSLPPSTDTRSRDDADDSGLGLEWVWFNLEIGGAYANMQSFSASTFALQKTESGGPVFGAAAGIRLLFFTLGVRARDLQLSSIGSLWQLDAEAAFHTRIWRIDPYFGVRGGYDFVGSLNSSTVQVAAGGSSSDVSVHGFNVGPMIGVDYYFEKWISLGVDADAQFLFLQRPPATLPQGVTVASLPAEQQALYKQSGSAVGISATGAAHLGIHF